MAQINTCLKRTFTIFNILFAIIGGLIICLALLTQIIQSRNGGSGLEGAFASILMLYIVGAITMVIAILGAYGAHKENKGCLIAFLVCMVLGTLVMLRGGITTAIGRPMLEDVIEDRFRKLLPLDKADESVRNVANNIQTQLECCGLFSYEDWENNIPSSCMCGPEQEMEGKCQTVDYRNLMLRSMSVYTQTCFPIIMHYFLLFADIIIVIFFSLGALALLGMVLSSIMIHSLRYPNRPTILLSVPTVFSSAPPKYQELHNPPSY
ncbi:uncharacterized protein V6R79_012532 [Siganus canaliculatus]